MAEVRECQPASQDNERQWDLAEVQQGQLNEAGHVLCSSVDWAV